MSSIINQNGGVADDTLPRVLQSIQTSLNGKVTFTTDVNGGLQQQLGSIYSPVVLQTPFVKQYPLAKWTAAKLLAKQNKGIARGVFAGESITVGMGSGTGTDGGTGAFKSSYVSQIINSLYGVFGNPISQEYFLGAVGVAAGYSAYQPKVSVGNNWTVTSSVQVINGWWETTTASSNTIDFQTSTEVDSFSVYYINITSTAQIQPQVDGSAAGYSVATSVASNNIGRADYTISGNLSPHKISIGTTAGSVGKFYLLGVVAWNSQATNVQFINLGVNGSKISDADYSGAGFNTANLLVNLNPSLTILMDTVNDTVSQTSVPAYIASLTSYYNRIKSFSDLIILYNTPCNQTGFTNGYADQLATAIQAFASANSLNAYDMRNLLGKDWAAMNAAGLAFDANHPNANAYSIVSNAIAPLLV